MNNLLHTITSCEPHLVAGESRKSNVIESLESGKVVYFPNYFFTPYDSEQILLSESVLKPKKKNISYDYCSDKLAGVADHATNLDISPIMRGFMRRFAEYAKSTVDNIAPQYAEQLLWGRTSYRPAEVKGRKSSKRKDDTRLHVDSFPATPVNGFRILRVFCNINPYGETRAWHIGEPFTDVLDKFSNAIPPYNVKKAKFLQWVKATKTLRSPYDHYMLKLHDAMKLDSHYQQNTHKHGVEFPSKSTWLVFTDHVSHAALSGQYLLEQTFYLPVTAMDNPEYSPLKLWQKKKKDITVN